MVEPTLLELFLAGEIDNKTFRHVDHVRVAFDLLRAHDFSTACYKFSTGLKTIAARAGNPGAYRETITLAFMALIAERSVAGGFDNAEDFIRGVPEVTNPAILQRWYTAEQLKSDLARRIFILPGAKRSDSPVSVS